MAPLCRVSRPEDVSRLKTLWKVCFGDEDAYIDHYFDTYYRPDRALVLEAEGEVCSMLLTFPYVLTMEDGKCQDACYIYAFCTDPAHQSKGYGRKLLRFAEVHAKRTGCIATVMVPGEKSLFDFYESLGYETGAVLREETMVPGAAGGCVPRPVSPERYGEEREKWLSGIAHVSYDRETLAYQHRLCRSSGGGFYESACGIAAVETDEDILYVKELLSSEPRAMISALMVQLGCKEAQVRTPAAAQKFSDIRPFAVIRWLDGSRPRNWKNSWLAFGFD